MKLHNISLTVYPPSNNDKYVCNNHVDFIYIYARHTKRNKKYTENGTKLFNWDQKKYIQHFLAQSIEQFRRSLPYKLFMLEGKRLVIEIAIANFGPSQPRFLTPAAGPKSHQSKLLTPTAGTQPPNLN